MALIHRTTLVPSKPQLLAGWLVTQDWAMSALDDADRDSSGRLRVEQIGSFRFDDPDGAVGVESVLLRTPTGTVLHVPVTYRDSPAPGADAELIGTAEHGVLGLRWVYDASHDQVYVSTAISAILSGATEAVEQVESTDGAHPRTPAVRAKGSGSDSSEAGPRPVDAVRTDQGRTVVRSGELELVVVRQPLTDRLADADETLTGS